MYDIMDYFSRQELGEEPIKRLYEIWPGKNRFFLKGRIMLGPISDLKPFCITLLVLVVLEIMFTLFICPYLWYEVSIMIPVLSLNIFMVSLLFMVLTMITDPGIIPRKEIFMAIGETPEIFLSEGEDKKKLCKTCNIYKPARSNHCRKCDNCVELYDHHCPFVNSCIGKNNYKYFMSMVVSLTLLGGMNLAGLILFFFNDSSNITSRSRNFYVVVKDSTFLMSVAVLLSLGISLLTLMVFCLCLFHVKISISGETTKEFRMNSANKSQNEWGANRVWFHPRLIIRTV